MFNIADNDLEKIDEWELLEFVLFQIAREHRGEKPHFVLSNILGCQERTIRNMRNRKSHLTIKQWHILSQKFRIVQRYFQINFSTRREQ